MTEQEAIALAKSGALMDLGVRERVLFQLQQPLLCMDFGQFHGDVQEVLGRPVWTHEFVNPGALLAELLGDKPAPTWEEILEMVPAEKRIVVVT